MVAAREPGEGDGGVDVVESGDTASIMLDEAGDLDPVGDVGADDHGVGGGDLPAVGFEVGEVAVIDEAAVVGIDEVAVRAGVPRHFALEEQDVVAARGEGAEQGAIGGGVAVAPRRAEAEAEDDELHAASVARARWAWKMASTSEPRRS
jgi:hypothetical protein